MKRTLKEQRDFLKATQGLFAVYSFVNGKREFGYVGLGLIESFEEIARRISEGKQIILMLASSDKECMKYEINNKCRVSYEWCRQFAVAPNYEGIWK